MNSYLIENCQTSDPAAFRANVAKCIEVLDQHRENEYAQIVLQMPESMEHNQWNYFIYPDLANGGYRASWQEIYDDEIEDYDIEHYDTAADILAALTPEEGGVAWYDFNIMEVSY